ncbi:MAG: tetratricopeptide repeat protein [Vicinamibacterales bacterium]
MAALIVLGAALVYANAFQGLFHLDDAAILRDPRISSVTDYVAHLPGMIRPALRFSFLVDRAVWGENPSGYHLLNVLFHIGSVFFFYLIARHLAGGDPGPSRRASREIVPVWAALLFLVHPIATETVTYVSGRATGMMAFFYLAGLYCYLRATAATRPSEARVASWPYAAAIACFALSLLSKEIAITFPLALLLVEFVARRRRGSQFRQAVWRFHLPFWGVLAGFLCAAALTPRYVYLLSVSRHIRPISENLIAQVHAVAYALTLFVLPGRLSIEHNFAPAGSLFVWPAFGSLLLIAALVAVAVACVRKHPIVAFGLFWFLLQLLPTNSVLARYDLLSERNLYLAAPGLFFAIASSWSACIAWVMESMPRPAARVSQASAYVLPFVLVPLLAMATVDRNAVYASPVRFWADAVRKAPSKARPHVNLGYAYYLAGDFDKAISEFRRALAIDRDDPVAQANLLAVWKLKETE